MQTVEVDGIRHAYHHTGKYDITTDQFIGGELAAIVNAKVGALMRQAVARGKTESDLIEDIRRVTSKV